MKIGQKLWSLECSQGFSMIWPTDIVFVPTLPIFKLDLDIVEIGPKLWSLEYSQGFSMIWPTDLVFDPTLLIFELDPDFIKANILTNYHDNWMHNVACIVFTRFFYHLTY